MNGINSKIVIPVEKKNKFEEKLINFFLIN